MIGTKVIIEQTEDGFKIEKESPRSKGKALLEDIEDVKKLIGIYFDKKWQEFADQESKEKGI